MADSLKRFLVMGIALCGLATQQLCRAQQPSQGINSIPSASAPLGATKTDAASKQRASEEAGPSIDAHAAESSSDALAVPTAPQATIGALPEGPSKFKPGFFARWGKAYLADWTGTSPVDPNA